MSDPKPNEYFQDEPPSFSIGQLVCHRRYRYRGVVVDFDLSCRADDQWYDSNRSQPDRDQPWYHVLVDGSDAVTYAAQTSLEADLGDQPIHHSLVPHLFERFESGRYERNDRVWPGWDGSGTTAAYDEE